MQPPDAQWLASSSFAPCPQFSPGWVGRVTIYCFKEIRVSAGDGEALARLRAAVAVRPGFQRHGPLDCAAEFRTGRLRNSRADQAEAVLRRTVVHGDHCLTGRDPAERTEPERRTWADRPGELLRRLRGLRRRRGERAHREVSLHLTRMRIALEEVLPVDKGDGEGLIADEVDGGLNVDAAGAAQVEVVKGRVVVDEERVRPGLEMRHPCAARVGQPDREAVFDTDVAGQHRVGSARGPGRSQEQRDHDRRDCSEDPHAANTGDLPDRFGHARSSAPKAWASASTILWRTFAASSSVSVRSGEPKATRNASDFLPSGIWPPRYSSNTRAAVSSGRPVARIRSRTAAAGAASSTTKARSWRTSGYGLISRNITALGTRSARASRSSSNALHAPSKTVGWSSPNQPSWVLAALPGWRNGSVVRSTAGSIL